MSNFRPSASQALQKAYKRGRLEKVGGKYRLNPNWEGGNVRCSRRRLQSSPITELNPCPLSCRHPNAPLDVLRWVKETVRLPPLPLPQPITPMLGANPPPSRPVPTRTTHQDHPSPPLHHLWLVLVHPSLQPLTCHLVHARQVWLVPRAGQVASITCYE